MILSVTTKYLPFWTIYTPTFTIVKRTATHAAKAIRQAQSSSVPLGHLLRSVHRGKIAKTTALPLGDLGNLCTTGKYRDGWGTTTRAAFRGQGSARPLALAQSCAARGDHASRWRSRSGQHYADLRYGSPCQHSSSASKIAKSTDPPLGDLGNLCTAGQALSRQAEAEAKTAERFRLG
jgi:hypothetical protein